VLAVKDATEIASRLVSGELDSGVVESIIVSEIIEKNPELRTLETFNTGEQYGLAVKKDANPELLRKVNGVPAKIRNDGTYDRIYAKWFGERAPE
jgi:polar amino acid transport system substrate-binding protein